VVRRRLQAFHDGELAIKDQIAVGTHLDGCGACAATLAEIRFVGSAMKLAAPGRVASVHDEGALVAGVTSRIKAERDEAFFVRLRRAFDDRHMVYAVAGSAAATIFCVAIMLGMMRFATAVRPDSLAALVELMATPGSSPNLIAIDAASHQRGTARSQAALESAEEDAVFALSAIVARDARLASLHHLRAENSRAARDQFKLIKALMDAVTRARVEPGTIRTPASVSEMVWLVTRTTVRANRIGGTDLPPSGARKRVTRLGVPPCRAATCSIA
jgi:hypothetical protein